MSVFRQKYRELSDFEKSQIEQIKNKADELYKIIELNTMANPYLEKPAENSNGREMSLAKTKLEECIMWAVKGMTK